MPHLHLIYRLFAMRAASQSCPSPSEGEILDAVCTTYEYDRDEYVWPHVSEFSRSSHSDIPPDQLDVMRAFVGGYSGICNFNYKVRSVSW